MVYRWVGKGQCGRGGEGGGEWREREWKAEINGGDGISLRRRSTGTRPTAQRSRPLIGAGRQPFTPPKASSWSLSRLLAFIVFASGWLYLPSSISPFSTVLGLPTTQSLLLQLLGRVNIHSPSQILLHEILQTCTIAAHFPTCHFFFDFQGHLPCTDNAIMNTYAIVRVAHHPKFSFESLLKCVMRRYHLPVMSNLVLRYAVLLQVCIA